jgi:4-hydroxy-4-methyl-2-oxoglutarate aldolase
LIEDPPLLTILLDRPRPEAALVARFQGAMTGHVIDAMDGAGALAAPIKPIDPARASFVGVALPCQTGPGDNLAVMAAVALARTGDVIVVAAEGFTGSAVVGDNVAWMARNAGAAAIVVDGAVRDAAGIRDIGLPVFAAAVTPNSCARSGPGRVGLPVVCGGVAVAAGDVLVGDADGIVVIPAVMLAGVASRLDRVREAERALQARIAEGITHPDAIAALLNGGNVRYV